MFFRRLEGPSSLVYLPYEETIIDVALAAAIQIMQENIFPLKSNLFRGTKQASGLSSKTGNRDEMIHRNRSLEAERTTAQTDEQKQKGFLENDIVILLLAQNIGSLCLFGRSAILSLLFGCVLPGCQDFGVCGSSVSLFLVRNFLQAIELFTVKLVELGVNI